MQCAIYDLFDLFDLSLNSILPLPRYRFVTEKESASQTSREELDFPIGYTIVFHDNIHQMSMLLSAIYRQHNLYCLHLDAKANGILKLATRMLTKCFSNIFVATKTERVVYASFSRLMADINCMRDMLGVPKTLFDWKYVINLCGQVSVHTCLCYSYIKYINFCVIGSILCKAG